MKISCPKCRHQFEVESQQARAVKARWAKAGPPEPDPVIIPNPPKRDLFPSMRPPPEIDRSISFFKESKK